MRADVQLTPSVNRRRRRTTGPQSLLDLRRTTIHTTHAAMIVCPSTALCAVSTGPAHLR